MWSTKDQCRARDYSQEFMRFGIRGNTTFVRLEMNNLSFRSQLLEITWGKVIFNTIKCLRGYVCINLFVAACIIYKFTKFTTLYTGLQPYCNVYVNVDILFKLSTYRSVELTLPVRSENSLISLDRKSSSKRSPCLAAARISSWWMIFYK